MDRLSVAPGVGPDGSESRWQWSQPAPPYRRRKWRGHRTHNGNAPSAKEHPAHTGAQGPGQAIGIADGKGSYAHFPVRGKIQTIAGVFAGVQRSHGSDSGVKRQHRPQLSAPAPGVIGSTQHPVQRHSHPGIVSAQIRDVQQPIAAQKVALARLDAPILQLLEQAAE